MKHLMTIIEIKVIDEHSRVIWQENNIKNTIHVGAELFLLSVAFNTTSGITVPSFYYAGMDNRNNVSTGDTLSNLQNEPTGNGYARVAVASSNGFNIAINTNGVYQATSTILSYSASGGSYGPVSNLFLATSVNNSGYLLATGALSSSQTLSPGQQITAKIGIALKDC